MFIIELYRETLNFIIYRTLLHKNEYWLDTCMSSTYHLLYTSADKDTDITNDKNEILYRNERKYYHKNSGIKKLNSLYMNISLPVHDITSWDTVTTWSCIIILIYVGFINVIIFNLWCRTFIGLSSHFINCIIIVFPQYGYLFLSDSSLPSAVWEVAVWVAELSPCVAWVHGAP